VNNKCLGKHHAKGEKRGEPGGNSKRVIGEEPMCKWMRSKSLGGNVYLLHFNGSIWEVKR